MSTVTEIPLISTSQKFEITLLSVVYNITVRWCAPGQFWSLDIRDQDNVDILLGVPLITGGDLLDGYEYLDIGGELRVVTDYDAGAPPTSSNLGTQSHLYFVTP